MDTWRTQVLRAIPGHDRLVGKHLASGCTAGGAGVREAIVTARRSSSARFLRVALCKQ